MSTKYRQVTCKSHPRNTQTMHTIPKTVINYLLTEFSLPDRRRRMDESHPHPHPSSLPCSPWFIIRKESSYTIAPSASVDNFPTLLDTLWLVLPTQWLCVRAQVGVSGLSVLSTDPIVAGKINRNPRYTWYVKWYLCFLGAGLVSTSFRRLE